MWILFESQSGKESYAKHSLLTAGLSPVINKKLQRWHIIVFLWIN